MTPELSRRGALAIQNMTERDEFIDALEKAGNWAGLSDSWKKVIEDAEKAAGAVFEGGDNGAYSLSVAPSNARTGQDGKVIDFRPNA